MGKIKIKGQRLWKLCVLIVFAVSISYCGFELNYTKILFQPSTANAGETIDVGLETMLITSAISYTNCRIVVGVLVPRSWNGLLNNNIVATYTSPRDGLGNIQTMSIIPDDVTPVGYTNTSWSEAMQQQAGLLGNLLPDVEWVAFWSDQVYPQISAQDSIFPIDINIKIKVGAQNTLVKLGYVISASADGLDITNGSNNVFVTLPSDCFSVTNGTQPLVDFCNPQLTFINPLEALDNDIITLTFDKNISPTALDNTDDIFMCATAYDTSGNVLSIICDQSEKSRLTPIGSKQYKLEFWPRQYFNIPAEKSIDHIDYYLTDASGTIKVGTTDTRPFSIYFTCN